MLKIWSNYLDQQRLEFINWNWLQVTVIHVEQETGQQGIQRNERFLRIARAGVKRDAFRQGGRRNYWVYYFTLNSKN